MHFMNSFCLIGLAIQDTTAQLLFSRSASHLGNKYPFVTPEQPKHARIRVIVGHVYLIR